MTFPFAFPERFRGWRRGAAVFGFVYTLLPRNVVAQTLPIELTWSAPPECPQQATVLSRARSLLGSKALKVDHVQADGTIAKRGDGFELTLLIDEGGKGGERKVWARQCDELSGAAAIALVLLLTSGDTATDGHGVDDVVPRGIDGSIDKPLVPPKPSPPVEDRDGSGNPGRTWRLLAATPQLAVGIGPLPKPTLGLGLGVGFQAQAWSVRLLAQWYSAQEVTAPVEPYGANVRRVAAGLWGCWDLHQGAWNFAPCLTASLAHLRATGYGPFLQPATQNQTSFGVGAGAIGRLQAFSSLALMVSVGAQVELARPIILLGTVGTVRQLAPASAIVQLGPEWIF